jgi:hypothetical protein
MHTCTHRTCTSGSEIGQTDCASARCVQATAEDQQTAPSLRYVPNFVRKALGMDNRRTEAHVVPRDANVAAAVLPSLSRRPLRPQPPPTPFQTVCSAYGRVIKHAAPYRYFVQILRDDNMMRTRIKSRSKEDDRQFGTC